MDGLSKQGQYALKKLIKRYGKEGGERVFQRQMDAGILPETYKAGVRGSFANRVAERFGAEEELGVKRGKKAW
jgi:hypothetical protein